MSESEKKDLQQIFKLIDTIADQRGISKKQAIIYIEESLSEMMEEQDGLSFGNKRLKTLLDEPEAPQILKLMVPDPTDVPPPPPRKKIGFKRDDNQFGDSND